MQSVLCVCHEVILFIACHKLSRENVNLNIYPSGNVLALRGSHQVLTCMVNGTPSDAPIWCKISDNGCIPVNLTSSINRNCSWLITTEITISNETAGQYKCLIFNKMQKVEVSLQERTTGKTKGTSYLYQITNPCFNNNIISSSYYYHSCISRGSYSYSAYCHDVSGYITALV